ncbi:unnamed protein product [Amoebophrya sp. A25]|nr:unnamed protein product [Amoebophrya sp. A25]|eukprot:GSA25T00023149001.1
MSVVASSSAGPKKAVVIGVTGFVGSYVARELLRKGYAVTGTCRDPATAAWVPAAVGGPVSLEALTFGPTVDKAKNAAVLADLAKGATGIFMCAGYEKQEPETIEVMQEMALSVLRAAESEVGGRDDSDELVVILTSSTGSTNPPPEKGLPALKSEVTHWSDPEKQAANKRFSPSAKTNMELQSLAFVGRDATNAIINKERATATKRLRLCIMNPSWILAPQLQPGPVSGNGLPWLAKIVKGESMADAVPNDSMSIIHCEDLAKLHVACLETPTATGRYFGVSQSWAWEDILQCAKEEIDDLRKGDETFKLEFKMPPVTYETRNPVTTFDNTRRDTLGVEIKGLGQILKPTLGYLKEKALI